MQYKEIIVATKNKGKVLEIKDFLKSYDISVLSLSDFPEIPDIEETGSTFEENAKLKAKAVYERFAIPTLADDSGLEVDALNGAPGVYSARYSGADANDLNNCNKLLAELGKLDFVSRTARFRCAIAFYDGVKFEVFQGVCEGKIGYDLKGDKGFGYDPLFIPVGYDMTFAEIDIKNKALISHRGKALGLFQSYFAELQRN